MAKFVLALAALQTDSPCGAGAVQRKGGGSGVPKHPDPPHSRFSSV